MNKIMTSALVVALTAGVAMGANIGYNTTNGNWNAYQSVDGHGWNTLDLSLALHAASPNAGRTIEVTTTDANAASTRIGNNGSSATVIVRNGGILTTTGNLGFGTTAGAGNTGYMTIESGGVVNAGGRVWLGTADTGAGHLDVQAGGALSLNGNLLVAGHLNSLSSLTIAGTVTQAAAGAAMVLGSDSATVARAGAVGTVTINGNGLLTLNNAAASFVIWDGSSLALNGLTSKMILAGDKVSIINDYVTASKIVTDMTSISATFDGVNTNVVAVPEPATIGMLGLGALLTFVVRRMKKHANS